MRKNVNEAQLFQSVRNTLLLSTGLIFSLSALGQAPVILNDLSAFENPGSTWTIAGNVTADPNQANTFKTMKGQGVLVNFIEKDQHGVDLFSREKFSDLDFELDYMMAKGSNSGIYLQGRYELQLLDSWGVERPKSGDNGGIYERWDEKRGKGNEGYDGHQPRQNVSRAPGLWQNLKVSFQAPRFDASGRKTENARFLKVELNGVVIHENVELQGPTRGAMENDEVAQGPLRIQGDHGAVAFRNIKIKNYDKPRPELTDLKYRVYPGKYEAQPDFAKLSSETEGTSLILTSEVNKKDNDFIIRYTGNLVVKEAGEYNFKLYATGGTGSLAVNNKVVIPFDQNISKPVKLPAGKYPVEFVYSKFVSWQKPSLGLSISSEGVREFLISDPTTITNESVDPILVDAPTNTLLRSFMDIPGGKRIVHAVNVGSPKQLHFTYDLDHGMIVQAWRGGFLDATPMWYDRGDGSSTPLGSRLFFGDPVYTVQKLSSPQAAWPTDTTGSGFLPKGYEVDARNNPTFKYYVHGARISDAIQVTEDGHALVRTLTVENSPVGLYVRLAEGKIIEPASNGLYLVDDKSYYIRIDEPGGATPIIRDAAGRKELIVPVRSTLGYSILF